MHYAKCAKCAKLLAFKKRFFASHPSLAKDDCERFRSSSSFAPFSTHLANAVVDLFFDLINTSICMAGDGGSLLHIVRLSLCSVVQRI